MISVVVLYLTVGVVVAGQSLSRGRVGTSGILSSFLFQTVLWPLFVIA